LDTAAGRQCCQEISREIANRVQEYIKNGNQLLAILGGNPESPGCAVNNESDHQGIERLAKNSGVLMQTLQEELRKREIERPFKGIRDYRAELLDEDLKWLEELFRAEKR
jgi:predicted secreted protein